MSEQPQFILIKQELLNELVEDLRWMHGITIVPNMLPKQYVEKLYKINVNNNSYYHCIKFRVSSDWISPVSGTGEYAKYLEELQPGKDHIVECDYFNSREELLEKCFDIFL